MLYHEHPVPAPLDAFVECVWFLRRGAADNTADADATSQRILPDGCAELIFHFGDRFHAVSTRGVQRQPGCFVVGLLTAPLVVQPAMHVDTMGVRFRPGGAYPFFREPLSALTDCAVSLDNLWNGDTAARLWHQLAAVPDDDARVDAISRELTFVAARAEPDRVTSAAVAALVATAGRARIGAVARRTATTPRQLQRRFAERVGVAPKVLARILRFQQTLLRRGPAARPDWVRIAVECGYSDQSHLIRDYAEFAGETPASLLAAEGELSAYFTAPRRLASLFTLRS